MAKDLIHRGKSNRSFIDLRKAEDVRRWTKHFKVEEARLAAAIEKVGNSAAAVRKELNVAPVTPARH